jgi:hypothetical protein
MITGDYLRNPETSEEKRGRRGDLSETLIIVAAGRSASARM